MINKILTVILLVITIYCLLKNRKKKQCRYGGENCPLADSDYNKIKTISLISCVECGNCAVESNGCCANCNFQTNLAVENHCHEHDHSHSHNHHHHDHSHQINGKEIFSLLLVPLIVGVIVYRMVISRILNKKGVSVYS